MNIEQVIEEKTSEMDKLLLQMGHAEIAELKQRFPAPAEVIGEEFHEDEQEELDEYGELEQTLNDLNGTSEFDSDVSFKFGNIAEGEPLLVNTDAMIATGEA